MYVFGRACVRACLCVSVYACVNFVFRPFTLLAIKKDVDYLFHSFVNEVIMRCFVYAYGKHCNVVGPVFTNVVTTKKDELWWEAFTIHYYSICVRLYLPYMHACILMICCLDVVCQLVPYTDWRRRYCQRG